MMGKSIKEIMKRYMKKRLRTVLIILTIICFIASNKQNIFAKSNCLNIFAKSNGISSTLNDKDIIAKSAVLIDGDSGRTLFEKNANMKMAMASTTKIMTCIVALENADANQIVKVSKKAISIAYNDTDDLNRILEALNMLEESAE